MSVGRYYHHLPLQYNRPPPLSAEHVALRDQLVEYNAAALELSSRLNAFSLPCKLPPEILSKIFVMSAAAVHEEDVRWNPVYGPRGGNHGYYRWISVALVCRYWRNVALGCAPFWAFIAFEKYHMPRDIYPALLRRSKGFPLTIVYHSREDCICQPCSSMWYVDSIGQEIISEELPRIRHLIIIIISSNDFSTYEIWQELVASAPSLETLEVGHTRLPDDCALDLPNSLFQSDLPRLRSLALRNFKYKWTNSLLRSSLRTLEIIDRSAPSPSSVDMHRFITMLSTMSQLEHLVVEGLSPAHPVNAVASLPQLRYIKLTGDVEGLAFVLFRLRFPSNTAIHLIISYAPNQSVARFVKAVSRTLSTSHLHTASYTDPDDFEPDSSYFRAWSGTLTGADRTVNRLWSPRSDIPPRILLAAREKVFISSIVARLYLPHLTALFVSVGCAMAPDCTWNKWFAGAPNVSFLRLSERAGYRVGELLSLRVRMQDGEARSSSDTDASDDEPSAESGSDSEPDAGVDTGLGSGSEADEESTSETEDVVSDEDTQARGADDDQGFVSQTSDGQEFHVDEGASGDHMNSPLADSDDESWIITAVMPSLRTIQFVDVVFPYASSLNDPKDSDRDPVERTREFDADGMLKGLEIRKNLGADEVERIEFVRCRGLQVSRLHTLADTVEDVVVDGNFVTKLD